MKPPPPPPVWTNGAPRSMAPTLAKLDRLAQDAKPTPRMSDYDLGHSHGTQAAYRRIGYVMTVAALCALVAWVVV